MASPAAPRSGVDPVKRVMSSSSGQSMGKIGKVTSNVTKRGEFGFPNGHLGYLTPEQDNALEEFKKMITAEGLYTPGKDDKLPSHSDALLLRFVRARRFVPKDALGQFKDTEQWRKLNGLVDLYMNIDVDDYDESRRHVSCHSKFAETVFILTIIQYPQWLGRRGTKVEDLYVND